MMTWVRNWLHDRHLENADYHTKRADYKAKLRQARQGRVRRALAVKNLFPGLWLSVAGLLIYAGAALLQDSGIDSDWLVALAALVLPFLGYLGFVWIRERRRATVELFTSYKAYYDGENRNPWEPFFEERADGKYLFRLVPNQEGFSYIDVDKVSCSLTMPKHTVHAKEPIVGPRRVSRDDPITFLYPDDFPEREATWRLPPGTDQIDWRIERADGIRHQGGGQIVIPKEGRRKR